MNSGIEINESATTSTQAQSPHRKGISCFWWVLGGLALLILILIGLGSFLIVSDKVTPADAIVVLSGGDSDRLSQAARLFKKGYGSTVILTRTGIGRFRTLRLILTI